MKNILEHFENTHERFSERIAVGDENKALTYDQLKVNSQRIGSSIGGQLDGKSHPIALYLEKSAELVCAMLGTMYSGNFYVVLDTQMPNDRIISIFDSLHPSMVLTDKDHYENAVSFFEKEKILIYEEAVEKEENREFLESARRNCVATDPAYVLYTSGSTGKPKGTVVSHQALLAYTDWFCGTFDFDETSVFGSQTPLYFSMSVSDLYGSIRSGARYQIIPKSYFSFPLKLVEYMNQYEINSIYWVPSALNIVANWDTFAYAKPQFLKTVLFAGEVMPVKQLNYWRKHFPNVLYGNLFGPTETTDICTYYVLDRDFEDHESLPIGIACDNCQLLIVDENGQASNKGELLVKSPFLASGYYNNPEKTAEAFIKNPLNTAYPEVVYRTGDLVEMGQDGLLRYMGRKDFQIKHMGYRIELGEIEAAVSAVPEVMACVAIYVQEKEKIVLYYQGKIDKKDLAGQMKKKLPAYMMPNKFINLKQMPYNANGKIDRNYLKNNKMEEQ